VLVRRSGSVSFATTDCRTLLIQDRCARRLDLHPPRRRTLAWGPCSQVPAGIAPEDRRVATNRIRDKPCLSAQLAGILSLSEGKTLIALVVTADSSFSVRS
jgi:hypothetical protein